MQLSFIVYILNSTTVNVLLHLQTVIAYKWGLKFTSFIVINIVPPKPFTKFCDRLETSEFRNSLSLIVWRFNQ